MLHTLNQVTQRRRKTASTEGTDVDDYNQPSFPEPEHYNSGRNGPGLAADDPATKEKPDAQKGPSKQLAEEVVIAGQRPSVWSVYNSRAKRYDEQLLGSWSASMDVLLVFAALFTAIVTTFAVDSIKNFDEEDITAQLLRVIIAQQYPDVTPLPQQEPPPHALTVNILWFTSILCTLFASTGAMLCKEWCTQYLNREDPTGLAERACSRQYAFDAIVNWNMGAIAVSIPTVLHLAIFLFLVGLWQSLTPKNAVLGSIVGFFTIVLLLMYVFLTVLPVFAHAPFSTSTTIIIQHGYRYYLNFKQRHLSRLQPPPIYHQFASHMPTRSQQTAPNKKKSISMKQQLHNTSSSVRLFVHEVLAFKPDHLRNPILSSVFAFVFKATRATAGFIASLKPGIKPLTPDNIVVKEAPLVTTDNPTTKVRALLWIFPMPVKLADTEEMLGLLYETIQEYPECLSFAVRHVNVLTLCLRSVLDDKVITLEEERVALLCLRVLARIRDHHLLGIHEAESVVPVDANVNEVVNSLVPAASDSTVYIGHESSDDLAKVIAAAWVCPSDAKTRNLVRRINSHFASEHILEESTLIEMIRAVHAWLRLSRSTSRPSSVPLLSFWEITPTMTTFPSQKVIEALLFYFADLVTLRPLYSSAVTSTTTVSSVIVHLINHLNSWQMQMQEREVPFQWLCDITCHLWKTNPSLVDEWVGVALLRSAQTEDVDWMRLHSAKMHAIANGPKVLHDNIVRPLTTLADIYVRIMTMSMVSVGTVPFSPGFYASTIHAYAATLDHAIIGGSQNISLTDDIQHSGLYLMRHLRTHHRSERHETILPSVYSLSIAFHLCPSMIEEVDWPFWSDLLFDIERMEEVDEDQISKELDAKMHIAIVLDSCSRLGGRRESMVSEVDRRSEGLMPCLMGIILDSDRYSVQIMWKALYVFVTVSRFLTGDVLRIRGGLLADFERGRESGHPFVDPGWENMRADFQACGLDTLVGEIPGTMMFEKSVFDWHEGFPLLRLYPRQLCAMVKCRLLIVPYLPFE